MCGQFATAFHKMRSEEEHKLADIVEKRGGIEAVKADDTQLHAVFRSAKRTDLQEDSTTGLHDGEGSQPFESVREGAGLADGSKESSQPLYTFDAFKTELNEDWDSLLKSNLGGFQIKFDMITEQLNNMCVNVQNLRKEMQDAPYQLVHNEVSHSFCGPIDDRRISFAICRR